MRAKLASSPDFLPTVLDFEVIEQLSEGRRSFVYRGRHLHTNEIVILKTVTDTTAARESVARIKREFNITERLGRSVEGVVRAHQLAFSGDICFMVMEDIGGESLERLAAKGSIDLAHGLRIMAQMAKTLEGIHAQHVVHKDITPSNIIVNLRSGEARLIDFGSASELSRETPNFSEPDLIEGTLAYISPEQTGRMNRGLDFRSDYYSLGAAFYDVLTGRPPFESTNALELLHAHIARIPEAPHHIDPKIPVAVSKIILKLLAKDADGRYQSGKGLIADIEEVLQRLEQRLSTSDFVPGRYDVPARFQIAQKLYGREEETATLMSAFERVSRGRSELLLVGGYSGIGKSSLVHEVHKPITQKRGFYVAGKFDQLQRDIPYSAVLAAVTNLIEQRLTEPEERVQEWRSRAKKAVGDLGRVLIDLLPNAELLIGASPPVPSVGAAEAEKRFLAVFKDFLQIFCDEQHPLVLFLDDLQWADNASLKLTESLLTSRDLHHLLLVGAYRDNEVGASHPLVRVLRTIEQSGAAITNITLGCLLDSHIRELLSDTLGCTPEEAGSLAELLFEKTQGNAFFLTQFLKSLHEDGLLVCQAKPISVGEAGDARPWAWTWQIEAIRERGMAENVVELMTRKISRLPADQQRILKLAACLGNRFDLDKLAIVCESSPHEILAILLPILEEGLLLPLDENYKLVAVTDPKLRSHISAFRFLHDRVQEASYLLIDPAIRAETHLSIGRLLRKHVKPEALSDQIFEIVSQFDAGLACVTDPDEAADIARLCLMAGRKAKAAVAFSTALKVLATGLEALAPRHSWLTQFDLFFGLYNELALCEYLTGRFESSDAHFRMLCEKAQTKAQIGRVYGEAVYLHTTLNEYHVAIDLARQGLARLGMDFPREITGDILQKEFKRAEETLGARTISALYEMPELEDPNLIAPFGILNMAIPPCWLALPPAFAWCTLQMVNLSQRHGNTPISAFGYGIHALLLCGGPEQYQRGLEYGELAIRLNERFPDVFIKGTIHFFYSCFVQHWKRHKKHNLHMHEIAERFCADGGAYVYGVYNVIFFFFQSFYSDRSLEQVRDLYESKRALVKQVGDQDVLGVLTLLVQLTRNLGDQTESDTSLDDSNFKEMDYARELDARQYGNGLCYYHFVKMVVHFYLERFDEALDAAERLLPYYVFTHGLYHRFLFHFYRALSITAVLPSASAERKEKLTKLVDEDKQFIAKCAAECPDNFEAQRALLNAEIARVDGHSMQAMQLYQEAIARASDDDCLPGRALAEELTAKFCMDQALADYARAHALRATSAYAAWGATRKLRILRTHHESLFTTPIAIPVRWPSSPQLLERAQEDTLRRTPQSSGLKQNEIDVESLLEASHILAREVDLEKLIRNVMRIVVMHVGANRGALVLARKEELFVEAEFNSQADETIVNPHPLVKSQRVPHSVIFLAHRKGESLQIPSLRDDPRFSQDPYILRTDIRSALCIPLDAQSERVGVVYLENDSIDGAWTTRNIQVARLLSTHAAISIRNALYISRLISVSADLERHNQELEAQRASIMALSVPILEIGHGILAVPLIGNLDPTRMDRIATSLLNEVNQRQAHTVIIDTTGLASVDETTIAHLLSLAQMMKLLGSQMLISGIRANIARAIIEQGTGFQNLITTSSLKEALVKLGRKL